MPKNKIVLFALTLLIIINNARGPAPLPGVPLTTGGRFINQL
jgi:hypothetical protein